MCRIRRGPPRDLCAETSGHGVFVMRDPPTRRRLGGRYESAMTHWQQYLALLGGSGQLEKGSELSVGVNLQGLSERYTSQAHS